MIISTFLILLLFVIAGFALLLFKPRWCGYLFVFFCVFQVAYFGRWSNVSIPKGIVWLPFGLAAVLLLIVLARLCAGRRALLFRGSPLTRLLMLVSGIFLIGMASVATGDTNWLATLVGLRYYLLLLVAAIYLFMSGILPLNLMGFMRLTVMLGLIQIPFVIVQRIAFGVLKVNVFGDNLDLISGTMMDYSSLGFLQLFCVSMVLSYWLRTGKALLGKNVWLLLVALYFPLLLTNSYAPFFYLIVLIAFIGIRHRSVILAKYAPQFMSMIVVFAIGCIFVFGVLQKEDYSNAENYADPEYVSRVLLAPSLYSKNVMPGEDLRMGRLTAVVTACSLIAQDVKSLFLGLGIETTQSSKLLGSRGKYYQENGPLCGLGRNSLAQVIAETGLMGVMLWVLLFAGITRHSARLSAERHHLIYSDISSVLIFLVLAMSIYYGDLRDFIVLLLLGYFIAVLQQERYVREKNDVPRVAA